MLFWGGIVSFLFNSVTWAHKSSLSDSIRAYAISDIPLGSQDTSLIAGLKIPFHKKGVSEDVFLIRGDFKKRQTSQKENVFIIWRELILKKRKKVKRIGSLSALYSSLKIEKPLIPKGTVLWLKGNLSTLEDKIKRTQKLKKGNKYPSKVSSKLLPRSSEGKREKISFLSSENPAKILSGSYEKHARSDFYRIGSPLNGQEKEKKIYQTHGYPRFLERPPIEVFKNQDGQHPKLQEKFSKLIEPHKHGNFRLSNDQKAKNLSLKEEEENLRHPKREEKKHHVSQVCPQVKANPHEAFKVKIRSKVPQEKDKKLQTLEDKDSGAKNEEENSHFSEVASEIKTEPLKAFGIKSFSRASQAESKKLEILEDKNADLAGKRKSFLQENNGSTIDFPSKEEIEIKVLKSGCSPRVDEDQEIVVIQTRSVFFKNGEIYKEEPCSDSNERYLLKKRYEGCPDLILKSEGRAHPQYKRYWKDDKKNIHEVDRICIPDREIHFEVKEDEEACNMHLDLEHNCVFRMGELYYNDRCNRRIVLESCRPLLQKKPLPFQKFFCGYRHNFDEGTSIPQMRIVTFLKGSEKRLTPCHDDGEALSHHISHFECSPLLDERSGKRFSQARIMIETPEGPLFITPCQPFQELQETWEGCASQFDHNFQIGESRGYTRFFYKKDDKRIYVTECEPSKQVFLHQFEEKGYLHDDRTKTSRPKTAIYILVPYAGKVLIEPEEVREDAPLIPYKLENAYEKKDEKNVFYEGCFKITPYLRAQVYRRPDGTLFEQLVGKGSPQKSHNLCKITEEFLEHKSSSWVLNINGKPNPDASHPSGSVDGEWLACDAAARKVKWEKGHGLRFFLYHHSFKEKRLKTEFPSGEVSLSDLEIISPSQCVRTQVCCY